MTVRVGELSSQIDIRGDRQGGASGGREGSAALQPGWAERERHQRLAEADRCDRERVAGEGFGA